MAFKKINLPESAIFSVFLFLLVFSVVFANQSADMIRLAGRGLHLGSISVAFLLLFISTSVRSVFFFLLVTTAYVAGEFGHRPPYEAALLCFAFFIGMQKSEAHAEILLNLLLAVTATTSVVMLLQVLGVHESLFLLSTHGYLPDGRMIPLDLTPTFFVDYYSLGGNFLQGRPSGILHSNQFASFVIVMTVATFLAVRQSPSKLQCAILAVAAVLTLSKVLTVFILVAYFFGRKRLNAAQKKNSAYIALFYILFLVIYKFLFPGLVTTYFLNPHVILASMATRMLDILVPLGFDREYLESIVAALMNWLSGNPDARAITRTLVIEIGATSRVSLYATLVAYSGQLSFLVSLLVLFCVWSSTFFEKVIKWLSMFYQSSGFFPFVGLAVFSLAADFSGMALFWYFLGLAAALGNVAGYGDPRPRDKNSPANSDSIESQDGTA